MKNALDAPAKAGAKQPTSLEMASEMYVMAFEMKKHRFRLKFPDLDEKELHKMTVTYFVGLPKD